MQNERPPLSRALRAADELERWLAYTYEVVLPCLFFPHLLNECYANYLHGMQGSATREGLTLMAVPTPLGKVRP
jgi:hypothetical protein